MTWPRGLCVLPALLALALLPVGPAQATGWSAHRRHGHRSIRVSSVRYVDGHPQVFVQTVDDPAAAREAVTTGKHARRTVAVSVDHRVSAQQIQSDDTDRWAQWALNRLDAEALNDTDKIRALAAAESLLGWLNRRSEERSGGA